ncbi:MAG: hypothetical protein RLZZ241_2588 [Bacteroidota bacterium]|jgi:asparagine synthase (glutamine-hydrolysing)
MCGFLFSTKTQSKASFIERLETIKFRGPDFTGYQCQDGMHFGHLRLSILDLDPRSNQPFDYDRFTLLFNGEIYNFQEIREALKQKGYDFSTESDTEVLIKGYHAWGEHVLQRLNGMFAFLIYDKDAKILFGARDRLGVKPFYYSLIGNEFEACSQVAPLNSGNSLTLNHEAIDIYLDCGFIPSPHSIYREVKKLDPGKFFRYSIVEQTMVIETYWDLKPEQPFTGSLSEAKEALKTLLFDAVRIRLFSDVPLGSFLSSGIDSALVTAIASKINPGQLNTFTIGFNDTFKDESEVAQKYAHLLNTNHKTLFCGPEEILDYLPMLVSVFDEPFGDNSALPTLLLNDKTKAHVTVALSGDGGDESFLGYYHFESLKKYEKIIGLPLWMRMLLMKVFKVLGLFDSEMRQKLSVKSKSDYIFRIFSRMGTLLNTPNNKWLKDYYSYQSASNNLLQQAADVNIKMWLEGDSNTKVDRGSMAYAVEVRSPFLDYRIVEFARSLPVEYRLILGNKKRILKEVLKDFIPEELFTLPKRGFSMPLDSWMRNELKSEIQETLNDAFFRKVPNLNEPLIRKLLKEHFEAQKNHSKNIWKVFILAKWMHHNKLV